jgi:hypothetical protein
MFYETKVTIIVNLTANFTLTEISADRTSVDSEAANESCLRVDYSYSYVDGDGVIDSIKFYETNVTITVDLTATFTLTEISADCTSADSEAANADLAYPVEAYICLDDNSVVANPVALAHGLFLQVCVRINDNVVIDNILVEDILTFIVTQPDGTATDSDTITNAVTDHLTDKVCRESGVCNVKTQLQSKFFTDINPSDLRVDGVAILAFGKAPSCLAPLPRLLLLDVVFVLFRSAALSPVTTSKPLWLPRRWRIRTMKSR